MRQLRYFAVLGEELNYRRAAERLFITQPDHARLAAEAIARWHDDGFATHPRRDVILLAAREHDNGWLEEDEATYLDPDGVPLDFVSAPLEVRQRLWPRAVDRVAVRDPYAAALIAQHAITVYAHYGNEPGWTAFFESYLRDLTHVRALHPETLSYLLRASGFRDVSIEYRSPIPEGDRLQPVSLAPGEGTPGLADLVSTFNENVELLNSRLFTYQDYAVIGRK